MMGSKTSHTSCVVSLRRKGVGYVVEGPGFYLWERNRHEALGLARQLAMVSAKVTGAPHVRIRIEPER